MGTGAYQEANITAWNQWIEAEGGQYPGRDFLFKSSSSSMVRGPISKLSIDGEDLVVELAWTAFKGGNQTPWTFWPKGEKLRRFNISWSEPQLRGGVISLTTNRGTVEFLNPNDRLPRSGLMNEYHIEVRVRHPLYPPSLSDLQNAATIHNVDPSRPQNQSEVKVAAITFVVFAFNRRAAEAWCRAECGRFRLSVVSMRRVQLLPGR